MNSLVPLEVMIVVDLDNTKPRGSPQILRDPQRSWGCDEPLAVSCSDTGPANPPGSIWKLRLRDDMGSR